MCIRDRLDAIKYEEISDKEAALLELEALGFVQNGKRDVFVKVQNSNFMLT